MIELPPSDTRRWTVRRDAVVQAVRLGLISLEEGCLLCDLSVAELLGWERVHNQHCQPRVAGHRLTDLPHNRRAEFGQREHLTMADSSSAPGGWQDDGNAEILALFRQWIEECRVADGVETDAPAWHEAMDRRLEIEQLIASCRCGPAGLAVKTFILLRSECSDWAPSLAQIRCEDLFRAGDPGWNTALLASILRDAAALVPEIGECAAAVIHEDAALIDAEMGIGWCYDRLRTRRGGSAPETQAKLVAQLDRIERTEARTPLGEAIKARRGGGHRDDGRDRNSLAGIIKQART
jgi:hypothetical protein